jgi:hypothetical protein
MSIGRKVCAEIGSEREKLSRQAKNKSATQQHPAKHLANPNSNKLHSLLPSCEKWRLVTLELPVKRQALGNPTG